MINLNTKLKFDKHKFNIDYYEVDTITDFEYLIILLTIDAFEKNITLEKSIETFTKGENDLKLIMVKRFESLFKTKIGSFKTIIDQAKSMAEETKKLNPAKTFEEIYYAPHLSLYLHDNKLISRSEIETKLIEPYKNNLQFVFNNISLEPLSTEAYASLDFELGEKLDSFNVLNLSNQNSEEILKTLKATLKERSENYIDFNWVDRKVVNVLSDKYKVLNRKYGIGSSLTQVGEFNSIYDGTLLEYDFSGEGRFIITEFVEYEDIPFIIDNELDYSNFKESIHYNKLLDLFKNIEYNPGDALIKVFINHSNTKEEFEIIKSKNWYMLDEKRVFDYIHLMTRFNINLINDDFIVKSKFIDHHFNSNKVELYKFLLNFYGDDKFEDVSRVKVSEILYSVYKKDSSILTKKDYDQIEWELKEYNVVNETTKGIVKNIASMRSSITKEIERLEGIAKSADVDESYDEIVEKANEDLKDIRPFKRIANFFVHITDPENKKYESDLRAIKKENKLFLNLKKDLTKNQNLEFSTEKLNEDYIPLLEEMEQKFIDIINKTKK